MTDTGPIPPEGTAPNPGPVPDPIPAGTPAATPTGDAGASFMAATAYTGPAPTADDKTMAMLAHLLGILTGFIGPLIIWLIKKDQSPFVNDQGKEALNFQITLAIAIVAGAILNFIFCIGVILWIAAGICGLIFGIMGGLKAKDGIAYRYPFAIRLIK